MERSNTFLSISVFMVWLQGINSASVITFLTICVLILTVLNGIKNFLKKDKK